MDILRPLFWIITATQASRNFSLRQLNQIAFCSGDFPIFALLALIRCVLSFLKIVKGKTMTEIIQVFFAIGLLISIAKTFGFIATRFGQPAVLGELLAGVLIGPSVVNLLHIAVLFPD